MWCPKQSEVCEFDTFKDLRGACSLWTKRNLRRCGNVQKNCTLATTIGHALLVLVQFHASKRETKTGFAVRRCIIVLMVHAGVIPREVGQLPYLEELDLSCNDLTGEWEPRPVGKFLCGLRSICLITRVLARNPVNDMTQVIRSRSLEHFRLGRSFSTTRAYDWFAQLSR